MASNEQINIQIRSDYDDKDAKKALADAKKIDDTEATVDVAVDDNASRELAGIDSKVDALDGRTAEATVDVDDNASVVVGDVDTTLDGIDGRTAEAVLDVDDNASRDIGDVDSDLDALDGRTATATVDTDIGPGLADVTSDLDAIDGGTFKATVDAGTGAGLTDVEGDLKAIDGGTYKATVDAGQGTGLTDAQGDLKAIDGGTYKATIDADASVAATGLFATIGGLPARIGEMGPALTNLAAVGGPIALVTGALIGAATEASNVAIEAQNIADLTGTSTEHASALQAVLKDTSDVEAKDLVDIIAQVTSSLEQNPGLLDKLGISADTVREGPFKTFVAVVDAWNSGLLSANEKIVIGSQLFGEEGLRQIGGLTSAIDGTLADAIAGISESRLIHPEDVQEARQMTREVAKLKAELGAVALNVGQVVVPALSGIAIALGKVTDALPGDIDVGDFLGGGAGAVSTWIGKMAEGEQVAADFEAAVRGGLITTDQFNAIIADGSITADELAEALPHAAEAATDAEGAYETAALTTQDYVDALDTSIAMLEDQASAQRDALAATEEQTEALLAANDVYYAEEKAVRDARKAVDDYNKVAHDGESTADDQAEALDRVAESAGDVADAAVEQAKQTQEAEGRTLSHTAALDIQNDSLIGQAAQLTGPTREALLDYIGRLNDIPPEVISQILALLDAGKIQEAEAVLTNTSRTRESTVKADADAGSVAATESELNNLARDREARIIATVSAVFASAAALSVFGGSTAVSSVAPAPTPTPTPQPGTGDTYNLNLPRGTRMTDAVRELDRHARRNGRRPYAFR